MDRVTIDRGNSPKASLERELQIRIREKLETSPYYPLRQIHCEINDGIPELYGTVPSYFMKQMAQAVVSNIIGGPCRIRNFLQVENAPTSPGVARTSVAGVNSLS